MGQRTVQQMDLHACTFNVTFIHNTAIQTLSLKCSLELFLLPISSGRTLQTWLLICTHSRTTQQFSAGAFLCRTPDATNTVQMPPTQFRYILRSPPQHKDHFSKTSCGVEKERERRLEILEKSSVHLATLYVNSPL